MTTHSPEGPHNTETDSDIVRRGLYGEPVDPPTEHQDTHATKEEINRLTRELEEANAAKAEAKRKSRNRLFVAVGTSAAVLVGSGVAVVASMGGESDPRAEAPADPGEQAPVDENPGEPVAENPGTSPTDIPSFEDDPVVTPEVTGPSSPEDIKRLGEVTENGEPVFTNEQIREWFHIEDNDLVTAQVFLPDYMLEHGAAGNSVQAEQWMETGEEPVYSYATYELDPVTNETIYYFEDHQRVLLTGMNMVLASPDLFDEQKTDPHFRSMALRGTFGMLIDDIASEGLGCPTDCTKPEDDYLISNLLKEIESLPDDVVVTELNISGVVDSRSILPADSHGTSIIYWTRDSDGSVEEHQYQLTHTKPHFALPERTAEDRLSFNYEPSINGPVAPAYFNHFPAN